MRVVAGIANFVLDVAHLFVGIHFNGWVILAFGAGRVHLVGKELAFGAMARTTATVEFGKVDVEREEEP